MTIRGSVDNDDNDDDDGFVNVYRVDSIYQGLAFVARMMDDAITKLSCDDYSSIFGDGGKLNNLKSFTIEFENVKHSSETYENISTDMYDTIKKLEL